MGEPNPRLIMETRSARAGAAGTTCGLPPPCRSLEPHRSTTAAPAAGAPAAKGRFLVGLLRALSAWPV